MTGLFVLLVVGTFNGQPTVATTEFGSEKLCMGFARELLQHDGVTFVKCMEERDPI